MYISFFFPKSPSNLSNSLYLQAFRSHFLSSFLCTIRYTPLTLISGYIFVHIKEETFVPVLTTPGVVTFLKEKGKAVAIPAEQIERLRFVENQADEPLEISYEDIPAGTLVEVVRGKLAGFQGEMVQIRDKYRIVLRLEKLGCALITVAASCVEKVKNYSKKGYVLGFLFIFVTP